MQTCHFWVFRGSLSQPKLSQITAFMHTSDSFYFTDIYFSAQNAICSVVTYRSSAHLSKSKSNIITPFFAMNSSLSEAESKCIPKHASSP